MNYADFHNRILAHNSNVNVKLLTLETELYAIKQILIEKGIASEDYVERRIEEEFDNFCKRANI